jgi:DNA polymerase-1
MIKIIEEGGDIHTKIARMVFGHDDITKQERQLGKKIGHASNYGMGPFRLAEIVWEEEGITISKKEAEKLQGDYFAAFPRIKLWHKAVQSTLSRTRKLTNPLGRTRAFLGYWGESLFKEGYAFLPQSTIADRVNLALIELSKAGLDVRLQTHDEILVNTKKENLDKEVAMVVQSMTAPFTINEHKVSIPVEVSYGESWGSCVPYTTNDGSK